MSERETNHSDNTQPGFFYGFIVVAAALLIMLLAYGIRLSFGVFFKPMATEFGWARALTSGAFTLSMIMQGVWGIFMGKLNDRFGPRFIMTLCCFCLGLGFVLMSQIGHVWQLYLFYGVIIGVGMSGVWVPQMSSIARWFVRRRSLMTGIVIAGTGISQLIAPPVVSRLIDAYDWRLSFVILGGVVLIAVVLSAQFLRRDPAQMGQRPYGENERTRQELKSETKALSFREAICTAQFWIAFMILFCYAFGAFSILVHIVPHAIGLGVSSVSAANILAVMGGIGILGNYVLGGIGDRIGNRQVFIIGYIMMTASLFWLVPAREVLMLYLSMVILGFSFGGMAAVESPLVAKLFGLSSHGLIYGVIHVGFTIGAALGPFLMGYIFDVTGSYYMAFLVCSAITVVGLIFALILRPAKRLGSRI